MCVCVVVCANVLAIYGGKHAYRCPAEVVLKIHNIGVVQYDVCLDARIEGKEIRKRFHNTDIRSAWKHGLVARARAREG